MFLDDIKQKINEHNLISFDIFDTLLLRPYVTPENLWDHLGDIYNVANFRNIRWWAFLDAREKYCKEGIDEVTIDQIYEFIPEEYKFLQEKEMDLEFKVLQQNYEMKQVVDFAIASGKKVIAVSDMYLPKYFLRKLLDKNGYSEISQIYVSSEIKLLKGRGELYNYVLNEEKISASKVLHIGDNFHSDVEMAKKNGIDAVYYPKIIDKYFENNFRAKDYYEKNKISLETSIMIGLFALFLHNNNLLTPTELDSEKYWYKIGVEYAAPLAFGFSQWLDKKFKEDNIEEALFVARDGYILQKVFEIVNPHFKTHYIYAPRMLSLAGSLDLDKKFEYSDFESISGIKALKNYFENKYENINDENSDNEPDLSSRRSAYKYFMEKKAVWKKYSEAEIEYYKNYLEFLHKEDTAKFANRIAMVDLMTTFYTAQVFLQKVLSHKDTIGYYYWVAPEYQHHYSKFLKFTSFSQYRYYIPFVELLITSPELPITGIKDFKPVYKSNNVEKEIIRAEISKYISKGAVDFVQFIYKIFSHDEININYSFINTWIDRFRYTPSKIDAEMFENLSHAWEINHSNYKPIFPNWKIKKNRNLTTLQKIFSVKNEDNHKVLRCCGVKVKFKRKIAK